ncbi:hypothetical protein V6N13_070135 [Hibiscus sabdariffa]|uniref:Uncharacterized protein n=1 Tax=Hibiscus sabdariffa TaxID=183260 RepID=A0ABR2NB69_9ROSI
MPQNPVKSPATYPNFPTRQDRSVVSSHFGSPDYSKNFVNEVPDMHAPKQGKLPLEQFDDEYTQQHPMFSHNGSKRRGFNSGALPATHAGLRPLLDFNSLYVFRFVDGVGDQVRGVDNRG